MDLKEYLEEIEKLETNQSKLKADEFLAIMEKASEKLSGAYKVRFKKLAFLENDNDIFDDDIPF